MICVGDEEEIEMAVVEDVKVDVKDSLKKSLKEVEDIRSGKLPKRSYKEMMKRVRQNLKESQ